jgi:hypothetical protein
MNAQKLNDLALMLPAEWRGQFILFVKTGEAPQDFLEWVAEDPQGIAAISAVCDEAQRVFSALAESMRPKKTKLDLKISPEWLRKMSDKADAGCTSVGGFFYNTDATLDERVAAVLVAAQRLADDWKAAGRSRDELVREFGEFLGIKQEGKT